MKINERGRSMIEMLGVLAIIGVLSVGGISGYTNAMRKYKVNKTIEIVNEVIQNYRILRDTTNMKGVNVDFSGDEGIEALINYGIYPECKAKPSNFWEGDSVCEIPLGDLALFLNGGHVFNLYVFITKDTCVDFLSYNWQKVIPEEWKYNTVDDIVHKDIAVGYDNWTSIVRDDDWSDDEKIDNYNMQGIADACSKCKDNEHCAVSFLYGSEL